MLCGARPFPSCRYEKNKRTHPAITHAAPDVEVPEEDAEPLNDEQMNLPPQSDTLWHGWRLFYRKSQPELERHDKMRIRIQRRMKAMRPALKELPFSSQIKTPEKMKAVSDARAARKAAREKFKAHEIVACGA